MSEEEGKHPMTDGMDVYIGKSIGDTVDISLDSTCVALNCIPLVNKPSCIVSLSLFRA